MSSDKEELTEESISTGIMWSCSMSDIMHITGTLEMMDAPETTECTGCISSGIQYYLTLHLATLGDMRKLYNINNNSPVEYMYIWDQ